MSKSEKKLLYAALGQNFKMFFEKCYYEIDGGNVYTETIATELIIDKLNALINGNTTRLVLNMPPRTFKTTLVSIVCTAWLLGHDPKLKIQCISYGDDLAEDFSIKTLQIMQSNWYKKVFPKTILKKGRQKNSYFETTENGFRKASSLSGSLTGRGADIIIIDDPQKAQEILSEKKRKTSNEIFSSTIISRLDDKVEGKFIVVAQRLHMDDFSNYVQKFGKWDVLAIPALAETEETYTLSDGKVIERPAGSAINPTLEPPDKLEEIRAGMGEFNFSAQYQQSPIPAKGNIINFDDFVFYNNLPPANEIKYFQSWDVAIKTGENNDYSVCVTAAIHNKTAYIVNIWRDKLDFTDLLNKIKEMQHTYNAQRVIIEDATIGSSLITHLRQEGLCVMSYTPTLSKADRAAAKTYLIRSCRVCLPQSADWLADFKEEIQAFPYGRHDDQVDAFVQLLDEFERENNEGSQFIDLAEAMERRMQSQTPMELHMKQAMVQYRSSLLNLRRPPLF